MLLRLSVLILLVACLAAPAGADLLSYVQKPDRAFRWEKQREREMLGSTIYDLEMTSQVWQGIRWTHRLVVVRPSEIARPGTALMLITGGGGSDAETLLLAEAARRTGTVCAVLYNIPNQPLFDGKYEDDLIAHTFVQYLQTGDADWPLLFPMTKSAVRAMDALQAFAKKEGMPALDGFVVTGASKRGWTTWFSAVADPRVRGIIPMVYDNLNIPAQMPHQLATWGRYSEQIDDYTRRGLQAQLETPAGRRLGTMVDPYTYRNRITVPKLIINGTNDRYWTLDALNLYWRDLRGPKTVLYIPNAGHGLGDWDQVLSSIAAFTRSVAERQPFPEQTWRFRERGGKLHLEVTAPPTATSATLWTAPSETKDFRDAKWVPIEMRRTARGFAGEVPVPTAAFAAAFGQVTYEKESGSPFNLSTQIHIVGRARAAR